MAVYEHPFRFGIKHVLYAIALIGSSLAMFGLFGLFIAPFVLLVWHAVFRTGSKAAYDCKTPAKKSMTLAEFLVVVAIIGILVAMLLPAVRHAGETARIMSCGNNLKQIALALHNYHDAYGSFPPAYIADENGKPMHSWRVLILPFLEAGPLYDKYRFDEPWNGPNNRKLALDGRHVYQCPSHIAEPVKGFASYFAVTGPHTAWNGEKTKSLEDFSEEASSTAFVVEMPSRQVHWMAPVDVSIDEAIERWTDEAPNRSHMHADDEGFFITAFYGRNAAMVDGSILRVPPAISRDFASALLTVGDGRAVAPQKTFSERGLLRQINWSRIFRLGVFVGAALLPAFWLRRCAAMQKSP